MINMNILMLGWELPPHYVGGMGVVCDQLTRQMARDGASIEFVLPFQGNYSGISHMKVTAALDQDATTLMKSGGTYDSTYYEITAADGHKKTRTLYEQVHAFANNLRHTVKLGSFDIIHAHDWLTLKAGIEAKRISGLPLFVHIHATEYDRAGGGYGNPLVREIEYMGLHMADHIFAVSERTKQTLIEQYDLPAEKISVARNVMEIPRVLIDEEHDTYRYIQSMRDAGYGVVINAGRMTVQKGIYYLLEAAKLVIEKRPKTLFLLMGGGEQIPELLEQAASLGIARNVIFTGRVEGIGKQWRDGFRVADLFVMPSVSEPLGMVPYESVAYGAPALISKQSGIAEALQHVLKADYWDTFRMADQICAVLEHRSLHDALLRNAQQEQSLHTWAPVSRNIHTQYHRVVDEQRRMVGATI